MKLLWWCHVPNFKPPKAQCIVVFSWNIFVGTKSKSIPLWACLRNSWQNVPEGFLVKDTNWPTFVLERQSFASCYNTKTNGFVCRVFVLGLFLLISKSTTTRRWLTEAQSTVWAHKFQGRYFSMLKAKKNVL